MTLDEVIKQIDLANEILILAHEQPDGDAIGSSFAMALALENMGKKVDIFMKNIPRNFDFLPRRENVVGEPIDGKVYDLVIVLDCSSLDRINKEYLPFFEDAKYKIEIDHHNKNTMFADLNIVNHVSPATCQILVSSFEYMGIELTKEISTCLITGIITDTNGFKDENVTIETFDFASYVLNKGISLSKIYRQALHVLSRSKFEAHKLAMSRLEFLCDGKIAFTYITDEDTKNLELHAGDKEGIVEIGRNVEGVEVSIFLYSTPRGYKASLRSNDYVNVSDICVIFGGGGHIKAAATHMIMPFDEAKQRIIEEVAKKLK